MVAREELQGKWHQIKGQLKERWGQLTDDDLRVFNGNTEQLVGVIQQKTGETKAQINRFLDEVVESGTSTVNQATEAAREYAQQAGEYAHQKYDEMSDRVREGYAEAEQMVKQRPVESIAIAFGAGLITGVILGLITRGR